MCFNCPVTINVLSLNNSLSQGGICQLIGMVIFNQLTTINVQAFTSISHNYPSRLPIFSFGNTSAALYGTFRSNVTPLTEIINMNGLGKVKVVNSATVMIVEINNSKPGIYSQIQNSLFTLENNATIYAAINNSVTSEFVTLSNKMVMPVPYKILINDDIIVKLNLDGVTMPIKIGLSTPVHVTIYDSTFYDMLTVIVTDGSTLNFESCDFLLDTGTNGTSCLNITTATNTTNYTGDYTYAVYFNKARSGYEMSQDTSCVFGVIANKKIIEANYSALVSIVQNTTVALPETDYTLSCDISISNMIFVVNDTNVKKQFTNTRTYTFDSTDKIQILPCYNCNLAVTCHTGLSLLQSYTNLTATGTVTFNSASIWSNDANSSTALYIEDSFAPTIAWNCTAYLYAYNNNDFANNLPASMTAVLELVPNTVDNSYDYTTYGHWQFGHSSSQSGQASMITNNGLILGTTSATYSIDIDTNSTVAITDKTGMINQNLILAVTANSKVNITAAHATINLSGVVYTDYSLSNHYKTGLSASHSGSGSICTLSYFDSTLSFYIIDTTCYPYLGTIVDNDNRMLIYVVKDVNYKPTVQNSGIIVDNYASWYGPTVVPIDPVEGHSYNFNLNHAGFNFHVTDLNVKLCISSLNQVKILGDFDYIISSSSFGNNSDHTKSALELSGNVNVTLYDTIVFNVYGVGSVTFGTGIPVVVRGTDPTYNYGANTYDFSSFYSPLEFSIGINLVTDGDYNLSNITSDFTIHAAGLLTTNVIIDNFAYQLNLENNSSNLMTFTGSTFDVRTYYGIKAYGTGNILLTGDNLEFNTYSDSSATQQIIWTEGSGNLTLDPGSVTFNVSLFTPFYTINSHKTGNGIINTGDNDISGASHTPIYWSTLYDSTATNPFSSSHVSKFIAYSWDPYIRAQYTHADGSTNVIVHHVAFCGGHTTTATSVESAFAVTAYSANSISYAENLSELLTDSSTFTASYIGSFDGDSTNSYAVDTNRLVKVDLYLQDYSCTYIGNLDANIAFTPNNVDYGTVATYNYNITDTVAFPTMSFSGSNTIVASGDSDTTRTLCFHLSKGYAFRWYIFPTQNSSDTTNEHYGVVSNILTYSKDGGSYVSYSDYSDYSQNETTVDYFCVNHTRKDFYVKIPSSNGEYFTEGLAAIFQGYFTRHHSEHYLRESNELSVNYTGTNYLWPVLSTSGLSIPLITVIMKI